jgi:antitoxin VapB
MGCVQPSRVPYQFCTETHSGRCQIYIFASLNEENIGPFVSTRDPHDPLDAAHHTIYTRHMPINTRSEPVNQLTGTPAARLDRETALRDRLRALQNRVLSRPATGLEADKPFYDAL